MSLSVFLLLAFDTKRFAEGLERGNAIVLHFKLKTNRYHIKILFKKIMHDFTDFTDFKGSEYIIISLFFV